MSNEIKTVEQMETAIREHFKAMLPAELREYIKKQEMYSPTPLLKHEAIDFIIENKREDIADADSQRLSNEDTLICFCAELGLEWKNKKIDVKEIVAKYLRANNLDGLSLPDCDCCCFLGDDFMPCFTECSAIGFDVSTCEPGYKVFGDDGDAYITTEKPKKQSDNENEA